MPRSSRRSADRSTRSSASSLGLTCRLDRNPPKLSTRRVYTYSNIEPRHWTTSDIS